MLLTFIKKEVGASPRLLSVNVSMSLKTGPSPEITLQVVWSIKGLTSTLFAHWVKYYILFGHDYSFSAELHRLEDSLLSVQMTIIPLKILAYHYNLVTLVLEGHCNYILH
jgi:hypothetical protein